MQFLAQCRVLLPTSHPDYLAPRAAAAAPPQRERTAAAPPPRGVWLGAAAPGACERVAALVAGAAAVTVLVRGRAHVHATYRGTVVAGDRHWNLVLKRATEERPGQPLRKHAMLFLKGDGVVWVRPD